MHCIATGLCCAVIVTAFSYRWADLFYIELKQLQNHIITLKSDTTIQKSFYDE